MSCLAYLTLTLLGFEFFLGKLNFSIDWDVVFCLTLFQSRYGDGYTITMTMNEEKQENCLKFLQKVFPDGILKEEHLGTVISYQQLSFKISIFSLSSETFNFMKFRVGSHPSVGLV